MRKMYCDLRGLTLPKDDTVSSEPDPTKFDPVFVFTPEELREFAREAWEESKKPRGSFLQLESGEFVDSSFDDWYAKQEVEK